MPLLHSKHQKLILQCYPPGRDVDKKPNSSELSYLLYYASTRRVKLEKVGKFLEKKTTTDLRSISRYGNIQVTLLIIQNLIEKCSENLNVFAEYVVRIFQNVLRTKDLILIQTALRVFKVFCANADANMFIGAPELLSDFTEATTAFLELSSPSSDPLVVNQWRIISVKAAKYLAAPALPEPVSRPLLLLLNTVRAYYPALALSRELCAQSTRQSRKTRDDNTEDNVVIGIEWLDAAVAEAALDALKGYFGLGVVSQSLDAYNQFIQSHCEEDGFDEWNRAIGPALSGYIPVQLRFHILLFCLAHARAPHGLAMMKLFSDLLALDVSMIGLPVLDVLKELLALQMDYKGELWEPVLQECVRQLALNQYYPAQTQDMLEGTLVMLGDQFQLGLSTAGGEHGIQILFDDIQVLWEQNGGSLGENALFFLDTWLRYARCMSASKALMAPDMVLKYYTILRCFLSAQKHDKLKSEWPNYNNVLLDSVNPPEKGLFITDILDNFERVLSLYPEERSHIDALVQAAKDILLVYGINFVYFCVSYFLQWQGKSKVKDSFAYWLLAQCTQYLEAKKDSEIYFGSQDTDAFHELDVEIGRRINHRVSAGRWDQNIPVPEKVTRNSTSEPLTKKELLALFGKCDTTEKWIVQVASGYSPMSGGPEHPQETALVLSASKMNTSMLSGPAPLFGALKSASMGNLLKAKDLKSMVSKASLLGLDREQDVVEDAEMDEKLKDVVASLKFDKNEYLGGRLLSVL